MTVVGRKALLQAVGLMLAIVGLFGGFGRVFRQLETDLLGAVLDKLPGGGPVFVYDSSLVVVPEGKSFIRAVVLPSCSALGPVLAMSVLWLLARQYGRRGKAFEALVRASTVIFVGNFLRLLLSLVAGSWFGRSVLIAFHDTVAAAFGFVYVMAGLLVGLRVLLREDHPAGTPLESSPEVSLDPAGRAQEVAPC